jgi:hypothetical protein
MSQENVETMRAYVDVLNRRDTEACLQYVDPEGELQSAIIGGAEGRTYRGHQGFRDWMADSDEASRSCGLTPRSFATSATTYC